MTAYDLTTVNTTGNNAGYMPDRTYQIWEDNGAHKIRRHVFFVGQPDWGGATPAAADTVKTLLVGPGTLVLTTFATIITAGTAGSTISLGDSGSATQWMTNLSAATTGTSLSPLSAAKFYSAVDYLQVTIGTTVPTGAVISTGYLAVNIPNFTNM